jgi:hypothetical protein
MGDALALDLITPEAGAIYVMDRGYVDFQRLYVIHSRVASSLSFFRGLSLTLANSEQAYRPRGMRNIGSLSTIS